MRFGPQAAGLAVTTAPEAFTFVLQLCGGEAVEADVAGVPTLSEALISGTDKVWYSGGSSWPPKRTWMVGLSSLGFMLIYSRVLLRDRSIYRWRRGYGPSGNEKNRTAAPRASGAGRVVRYSERRKGRWLAGRPGLVRSRLTNTRLRGAALLRRPSLRGCNRWDSCPCGKKRRPLLRRRRSSDHQMALASDEGRPIDLLSCL